MSIEEFLDSRFEFGNRFYFGAVDEYGKPVSKSKSQYPYTYDGFVTYRNGTNDEITSTVYSDRLLQWDYEKTRILMLKHFGEQGDYYSNRQPEKIQSFLRDYTNDTTLKLILIMEYCNASTGYPVWRFDYSSSKTT